MTDPSPANDPQEAPSGPLVLASGGDDAFALSLAVTLFSALSHLKPGREVLVYVLDGGISDEHRARILRTLKLPQLRVQVEWIKPDITLLQGLKATEWHKTAAYMRLLLPDTLPPSLDKVIYLDSDVVVKTDLDRLWALPAQDVLALGVANFSAPVVSSPTALPETYAALGLAPDTVYCNTGVLVMNLRRWRAENVAARIIGFTRTHAQHVRYADQDGINAVLAGDWRLLDPRWNVQLQTLDRFPPDARVRGAARARAQAELARGAFVLHYTGRQKPWHTRYGTGYPEPFFDALRRSGWFDGGGYLRWWLGRRPLQQLWKGAGRVRRFALRRLGR